MPREWPTLPLEPDDKQAIREFWQFFKARRPEIIADLHRAIAAGGPELRDALHQAEAVEEAQRGFALQERAALDGRWDEYFEWLSSLGELYAEHRIGYSAWMWRTAVFRDAVRRAIEPNVAAGSAVLDGLLRLIDVTLNNILRGFIAAQERVVAGDEERYRALFEKSPTPMWTFDRETLRFIDVNDAAIEHYGYSRDEFLAMTLRDIRPPEDVPAMIENVAQAERRLDGGEVWRHRRKDGAIIVVEIRATDFVSAGRPVRLVLATDVTARERAQEALREAESQLRHAQKMEAIGQMAGGVAHDFNNVLTVVASYAELLEQSFDTSDQRCEDVAEIRRASERASRLTRQLLAMSRHSIVTPAPLSLDAVIADFTPMLRRAIGDRIALTVHRREVPAVLADEGHVEQVLLNLAVNARDAMPQGGRLAIEVDIIQVDDDDDPRRLACGQYVVLAVTDTGVGMDAETQRRIFEPFFTTKGPAQGTGLGLAIVHGIVSQAGGVVSVYSQPERGTTFRIYLPVTTAKVVATVSAEMIAPSSLPGVTVLVVDDDRNVREVAARILRDAGCHVVEAAGAEEARRACVTYDGTIDAVVLDLLLTDGRGEDVVRQLRQLRPAISVVLVSGYPAGALSVAGAPPRDLLAKPYSPAGLRAAVAHALGTKAPPPEQSIGAPRALEHEATSVLLAEDDLVLRRVIEQCLRTAGHTVVPVGSGSAAIAQLESRRFDVIVSDMYMPDGEGMDLLRAVRRLDLDVPVILMSGAPSIETATKAIEYGAFRYLTKPLDLEALGKDVRRAARAHALARLRRDAFSLRGSPTGAVDRAGLEVRFDQAIDGLWMAFQPLVDARDGGLFGVEALVRSTEPSMTGPLQLLDAATHLGQLTRLGRRVRSLSAGVLAAHGGSLNLFINLHPEDLLDVDLIDEASPLAKIAPRVVLEVTERASLTSSPALRARLERIRKLGFRLAVDDIGAGYSGLTSFTDLTPEIVKIDMSLVRDIHHNALKQRTVGALCRLCHEVGTLVVGEGVETIEERDCLVSLGCDLLQGYLIAHPAAALPAPRSVESIGAPTTQRQQAVPPDPASGTSLDNDIVDVFVRALARVLGDLLSEEIGVPAFEISKRFEPAPEIAAAIGVSGDLCGRVTLVPSFELARSLAHRMLSVSDASKRVIRNTIAELANIVVGQATGPLMDVGYDISIAPPDVLDESMSGILERDTLVATLTSVSGSVRMYLELT